MAPNDAQANVPSAALAYMAFNAVYGNYNLVVTPATPGKVDLGFATVSYVSLEGVLTAQAASNPAVSPVNVLSGVNVGQQATGGTTTQQDSTGTARTLTGFTPTQ